MTNDRVLARVRELREAFLTPHARGLRDYWDAPETLAAYDATLARRIAWKWDAVVDAIEARDGLAFRPFARALDWGCGTGVAARALLAGARGRLPGKETPLVVHDRSARAMAFAEDALRAEGAVAVARAPDAGAVDAAVDEDTLLLVSHVLTELDAAAREALFALAARAGGVVWVEPGTPFCAGHLVALRERMRAAGFEALLPCPHAAACGLAGGASSDWCHVYAEPPREVFRDAEWTRTARALGIDLRSLPVSFLFLSRRDRVGAAAFAPVGEGLVLGRPKALKGRTQVVTCAPGAVASTEIPHRSRKALARALERPEFLRAIPLADGDELG